MKIYFIEVSDNNGCDYTPLFNTLTTQLENAKVLLKRYNNFCPSWKLYQIGEKTIK
jgi:hypothetical protein